MAEQTHATAIEENTSLAELLETQQGVSQVREVVAAVARRYLLRKHEIDDYLCVALLALSELAGRGQRFSKQGTWRFLYPRVRGAIINYVRVNSRGEKARAAFRQSASVRSRRIGELCSFGHVASHLYYELLASRDGVYNPETYLERKQFVQELLRMIWRLPPAERTVIFKHYICDRTFCDIVREGIGIKKSGLSKLHVRARKHLKEELQKGDAVAKVAVGYY